jgi:hypothetical protein
MLVVAEQSRREEQFANWVRSENIKEKVEKK